MCALMVLKVNLIILHHVNLCTSLQEGLHKEYHVLVYYTHIAHTMTISWLIVQTVGAVQLEQLAQFCAGSARGGIYCGFS